MRQICLIIFPLLIRRNKVVENSLVQIGEEVPVRQVHPYIFWMGRLR